MERVLLSAPHLEVQVRHDGRVVAGEGGGVRVTGPFCSIGFATLPVGVRTALTELARPTTREALSATALAADGPVGLLRLQKILARLDGEGLLDHTVVDADGTTVARLVAVGRGATSLPDAPAAGDAVRLSRFAVVQAEDGVLVARAPGNHLAVELGAAAVPLVAGLAAWTTPATVWSDHELCGAVLRLFAAAGLLAPGGPDDDVELSGQDRAQWSATDLWLHSRSRRPLTVRGYGGTYRHRDRFDPPPAAPPPRTSDRVALPVPDLDALRSADPTLTDVLERRQSVREHDPQHPITADQLGELLYRAARQRGAFPGADGQELADRPYPSGGAVHELEIYPLINTCDGIAPGLWHYAANSHELELVSGPDERTAALVHSAREAGIMAADPQLVMILSARFGRVMWKYESVGYSLVLKHVGVVYQTFYLIGTAMGLAVCGLGGGDAAEFAAASGLDPFAESSVGELVIGSAPSTLPPRHDLPAAHGGQAR